MVKFENKINGRFYYLFVEKDSDNCFALRIFYGGKHVRRTRTALYEDSESFRKEIERITKRRLQRGYSLVA